MGRGIGTTKGSGGNRGKNNGTMLQWSGKFWSQLMWK